MARFILNLRSCIFKQRFGMNCGNPQKNLRRVLRFAPLLFPVPERSRADSHEEREFFLRKAEPRPQGFYIGFTKLKFTGRRRRSSHNPFSGKPKSWENNRCVPAPATPSLIP